MNESTKTSETEGLNLQNKVEEALRQHSAGMVTEATVTCREILAVDPDHATVLHLLGIMALQSARFDEAVPLIKCAIEIKPDVAETHLNLGIALHGSSNYGEAIQCFMAALDLRKDFAKAYYNLGLTFAATGKRQEAAASYHKAIMIDPGYTFANNNLGTLLKEQGRLGEAKACFDRALEADASYAECHFNLGAVLQEMGQTQAAKSSFEEAIKHRPQMAGWKIRKALSVPIIPASVDEIETCRSQLVNDLENLQRQGLQLDDPGSEVGATSFHLAYHNLPNRTLQQCIASLFMSVCPALGFQAPHVAGRVVTDTGKIRVGFLSAYFRSHTIGKLNIGFIEKLARDVFEVVVFQYPGKEDELSRRIEVAADDVIMLSRRLENDQSLVAEQKLDILFYPDLGMDPYTYFLSFARLAPVQAVAWGHPDTTGLPEMDYFVSSSLLEPEGATEHYSEKLVTLPTLPTFYYRPEIPKRKYTRAGFGLDDKDVIYLCPQTLFKFHPDFDELIADILLRDRQGVLVLIDDGCGGHWNRHLLDRLRGRLQDGVDRLVFVPRMDKLKFMGLLDVADAVLDISTFSGGNSSLEAFAMNVPIVTLPGDHMRSRVTAACYRQMGLDALIAKDKEAYVALAIRLAHDQSFRGRMRAEIRDSAHRLFECEEAVTAFEEFLKSSHQS